MRQEVEMFIVVFPSYQYQYLVGYICRPQMKLGEGNVFTGVCLFKGMFPVTTTKCH